MVKSSFDSRTFILLHLNPILPSLTTFSDNRFCACEMWATFFAVLSTPSIRVCEIRFPEMPEQELEALPPGERWLSPVEDLTMCCGLLLRHLTLPYLKSMTLGYNGECFVEAREFLPTFRDVLTRSNCPLTHICLFNIVEDQTILDVIPTIDTLEEVTFFGNSVDNWTRRYSQIIQDLIIRLQVRTPNGSAYDALPLLESFEVCICDCNEEDLFSIYRTLVDMVLDRARNGHLRAVKIFAVLPNIPSLRGLSQGGVEELRQLREELGMVIDISVEYNPEDPILERYL